MGKITFLSDYRQREGESMDPSFQPALLLYYPELSVVEICVSDAGLQDIGTGLTSGAVDPLVQIHSRDDFHYAVANVASLESFIQLAHNLQSVVVPNPYYLDSPSGAKMVWNRAGFIPPEAKSKYVISVDFSPLGDTWVFGTPKNLNQAVGVLRPNDMVPIASVGRLQGDVACFSLPSRALELMRHALRREDIVTISHNRTVNIPPPRGSVI